MATQAPVRLHHTAYLSKDLEATRKFYEDIVGLPLVATWSEADELFGAVRVYCHCLTAVLLRSSSSQRRRTRTNSIHR
jgi:catechol 2,3-dioxygenase-like lactoylglutathione lyase family enzyme